MNKKFKNLLEKYWGSNPNSPTRCLDCGESYGKHIFLWVADETWEKIGCGKDDFLCAHCTIDRIGSVGTYAYLIPEVGKHTIEEAGLKITATRRHEK